MRFRNRFMLINISIAVLLLFLSDPDSPVLRNLPMGASVITGLTTIFTVIFYVWLLEISCRALMDNDRIKRLVTKAEETSEGAGLTLVFIALTFISVAGVAIAAMMNF